MASNNQFQLEVIVNDKAIAMNSFVKEIVTNVIAALVQSLKVPDQPNKIEIKLTKT